MSEFVSALLGGLGGAGGAMPNISNRTPINVQPVGINLGEIIQPYTASYPNGGFGIDLPNRYISALGDTVDKKLTGGAKTEQGLSMEKKIAFAAIAGIGVFAITRLI